MGWVFGDAHVGAAGSGNDTAMRERTRLHHDLVSFEELPHAEVLKDSEPMAEPAGNTLCRELREQGEVLVLQLHGFQDESDRRAMVSQYLSLYLKELDDNSIDEIVSSPGANNPLFLKVLLSELRVFGSHEGLHDQITAQFGVTPQTAFDGLLDRLERDPGYSVVPTRELAVNLFGWLAHSKNGLEPSELAGLLEANGLAANDIDASDSTRSTCMRSLPTSTPKRPTTSRNVTTTEHAHARFFTTRGFAEGTRILRESVRAITSSAVR